MVFFSDILWEVWGYELDDDIEIIWVYICYFCIKLELNFCWFCFIKMVYGVGYCLELLMEEGGGSLM